MNTKINEVIELIKSIASSIVWRIIQYFANSSSESFLDNLKTIYLIMYMVIFRLRMIQLFMVQPVLEQLRYIQAPDGNLQGKDLLISALRLSLLVKNSMNGLLKMQSKEV